jgi:hypothetical protein
MVGPHRWFPQQKASNSMVLSELNTSNPGKRLSMRRLGAVAAGSALAAACYLSAAPASLAASAVSRCQEYVTGQDYDRAAMHCAAAANDGDAGSQAALGWMYLNGKGVPANEREAVRWTREAAEQGNTAAEAILGGMYLEGKSVAQDKEKAREWIARAADKGHRKAQVALGNLYVGEHPDASTGEAELTLASTGQRAVPSVVAPEPTAVSEAASEPDPEAAVKWYRKAAKNGSSAGQTAMGEAYRLGVGVEQDDVTAYMWYSLAADQGSDIAADARDAMSESMKPKQIEKAREKAREWQEDHADRIARVRSEAR